MGASQKELKTFYRAFWDEMESVRRTGKGSAESVRFVNANTSGTTSKTNIQIRFNIMLKRFLEKNPDLQLLDSRRLFDVYEKTVIYRKNEAKQKDGKARCESCKKEGAWSEYEADHIKSYSTGGQTSISNGQVLCIECNRKKGASQ